MRFPFCSAMLAVLAVLAASGVRAGEEWILEFEEGRAAAEARVKRLADRLRGKRLVFALPVAQATSLVSAGVRRAGRYRSSCSLTSTCR